jgi:phosphatidylinositol alpha-1,6-mannosyltransferase
VVTLDGAGGGVAYLGRLTRRALADLAEAPPRVAALAPATLGSVSRGEAARYLLRLAAAQASGATDWWIFNHVGVARPQSRLPAPLRRPYALWLCGVEAWDPALPPGRRRAMQSAAVRIAISAHTAARVRATHPDVGEIRVCPLALLPPEPVRGEPDRDLLRRIGPRAVCIVGRMSAAERYKGHDELLECWPGVISAVPDAQLVVVGAGDDAARLRGRAAELGIGDAVLFTGFVSDATREAVLERAAAFAMPSRGEGFGLVYLEAMRLGVPCIGSTVDAAREVVADGETGFTIDPDDRGALASSIVRLLSDEGARRAMGEAGRARYEAHFTYARFRERLGGLLGETFGSLP